jgi:hypothetical protein
MPIYALVLLMIWIISTSIYWTLFLYRYDNGRLVGITVGDIIMQIVALPVSIIIYVGIGIFHLAMFIINHFPKIFGKVIFKIGK